MIYYVGNRGYIEKGNTLTTITLSGAPVISIASQAAEFAQDIIDNLDGEATEYTAGKFTVRVADADVTQVKRLAKASGFTVVSEVQD